MHAFCSPAGTHGRPYHPLAWAFMTGPGRHRGGPRGGFGPGGFGGPGRGGPFRRGPRARRGDIRIAALLLLAEEPRNGYAIIQALEERTNGVWRPSPGSVYPTLAQLEDEGLIREEESDGRKAYHLTDAGRTAVEERGDKPAPWDALNEGADDGVVGLFDLIRQVGIAAAQIGQAGSAAQVEEARELLKEARRSLYRILAEDPSDEPG